MLTRRRALIIDDDKSQRQRLKTILGLRSFDVVEGSDGLEGIKLVTEQDFDVIFSDVSMPNMNGFEFLARIKRTPKITKIPVVMLTSESRPEDIEKGKSLGCSCYLIKPFNSQKLDEALQSAGLQGIASK